MVEWALAYRRAGWDPIPLCLPVATGGCRTHGPDCAEKDRGKAPLVSKWPELRGLSEKQIRAWGRRFGEFNIGVLLGGGRSCLDVDPRNGGAASYEQLELANEPIPASVKQLTPSGGWHQFGKYDAERLGRVRKYDPLPGLNFLAERAYVVVAPSVHVRTLETGETYAWEDREEPPRVDELPEFADWLVCPAKETKRAEPEDERAIPASEARRIGGALFCVPPERDGTWLSMLMAVKTAQGEGGWPVFDAWSRTTGADNYDPVENRKRWDSIRVGDGTDKTVNEETLFWTARKHGWTDPQPRPEKDQEWDKPIPFDDGPRPQFPLRCLGTQLADYADGLAVAYQVPVDLPAMLALATTAAAVAKKYAVRVRSGWIEALTLYVAVALMPGERKSPTLSRIVEPLASWEWAKAKEYASEIKVRNRRWEDANARVKALRAKVAAAKDKELPGLREKLEQAYEEFDAITLLVAPRARIDDTTPEALGRVISQNGGRIAALSSEGGLFETLAGRYNEGVANLDLVLKGWDGRDEWMRDRVGDSPLRVRSPIVTLGFAVQPDVIRGMAGKPGFRGRGLIGRFLFSVPDSLMGSREIAPQPLRPELQGWWALTLTRLLELPETRDDTGEIETTEIPLCPGAERLVQDFNREIEPRLGEDGDLRPLSDWAGKLVGTTARIAGLLHLVDGAGNEARAVTADAAGRAIEFARYGIEHAKVALEVMGADPAIERARDLLRWIRRRGVLAFSSTQALDGMRRTVRRMEFVLEALEILEERRYIRQAEQPSRKAAGRKPAAMWEVNPLVLASGDSSAQSAHPGGEGEPPGSGKPSAQSAQSEGGRASAGKPARRVAEQPEPRAASPELSVQSAQSEDEGDPGVAEGVAAGPSRSEGRGKPSAESAQSSPDAPGARRESSAQSAHSPRTVAEAAVGGRCADSTDGFGGSAGGKESARAPAEQPELDEDWSRIDGQWVNVRTGEVREEPDEPDEVAADEEDRLSA